MAFTIFTTTDFNNISRMMKIQSDDNDTMDVLQWDQITNIVSSPNNRLSTYMVSLVQERLNQLLATINPLDLPNMQYALGACCVFCDLTGVAAPLGVMSGTNSILRLVGFLPGQTAYVVAAIPHSIAPYQISSPQ